LPIIDYVDFSTGDLSQLDFARVCLGGEPGYCSAEVQSEIFHSPPYACRLWLADPCLGDIYRRIELYMGTEKGEPMVQRYTMPEVYVSGYLHLPPDFRLRQRPDGGKGWHTIMSIRELAGGESYQLTVVLQQRVVEDERNLQVASGVRGTVEPDQNFAFSEKPVPFGKWIHFVLHEVRGNPGLLEVYQDEDRIISVQRRTWGFQDNYRCEWKHYTNVCQYSQWTVWDDLTVSDTYPATPPPPPDPATFLSLTKGKFRSVLPVRVKFGKSRDQGRKNNNSKGNR